MSDRPLEDARALVERLYDAHGPSLYRYAALILADASAAEDVVQHVFTAILRQAPSIEDELPYLRRAIRNECYSHLRRRRWRAEVSDGGALVEAATAGVTEDERLQVEQAMRALSPEQREVVHLHVFEGWTFQAISDASGLSINTVAARYRYALDGLRRKLDSR